MAEINPKIIEKFSSYPGLPQSYVKFIKKILEAEDILTRKNSSKKEITSSYIHILREFADNEEILEYIKEKELDSTE